MDGERIQTSHCILSLHVPKLIKSSSGYALILTGRERKSAEDDKA